MLVAIWPNRASSQTAESLLSGCRIVAKAAVMDDRVEMQQTFGSGECWGSFGVVQKLIIMADADRRPLFNVCAPASSTRTQLTAIFVKYADDHPAKLHEDFLDIALEALRDAFPCKS